MVGLIGASGTVLPEFQLLYSKMRAREYGAPLIASANYGISGYGQPSDFVALPPGRQIIQNVSIRVPVQSSNATFYLRWHQIIDSSWILCPLILALALFLLTCTGVTD